VTADHIMLGVMGCLMLKWLADMHITKVRCSYCGGVNEHRQDCPHDFDQRGHE
jgi:hypothetical protein